MYKAKVRFIIVYDKMQSYEKKNRKPQIETLKNVFNMRRNTKWSETSFLSTIMFMYRNRRDHLFGMIDENNLSTSAVNEL